MHSLQRPSSKAMGFVFLIQGLTMFLPLMIMGPATGWPASLSDPAGVLLPQILTHQLSVQIGYFIYLLYSVFFMVTAYFFTLYANGKESLSLFSGIALGLGGLSVLARVIGIIRWLTVMPILALQGDISAGSSAALIYDSLNALAGGIGETMGVALFAGLWAVLLSARSLKTKALPPFLCWLGIVAGIAVMGPVAELFGAELGGYITATSTLIHLWYISGGVYLLWFSSKRGQSE